MSNVTSSEVVINQALAKSLRQAASFFESHAGLTLAILSLGQEGESQYAYCYKDIAYILEASASICQRIQTDPDFCVRYLLPNISKRLEEMSSKIGPP